MKFNDFKKNQTFYTGSGAWVVTDIGNNNIVAVQQTDSWGVFIDPPKSLVEYVFDEDDWGGCSLEPQRMKMMKWNDDPFGRQSKLIIPNWGEIYINHTIPGWDNCESSWELTVDHFNHNQSYKPTEYFTLAA